MAFRTLKLKQKVRQRNNEVEIICERLNKFKKVILKCFENARIWKPEGKKARAKGLFRRREKKALAPKSAKAFKGKQFYSKKAAASFKNSLKTLGFGANFLHNLLVHSFHKL